MSLSARPVSESLNHSTTPASRAPEACNGEDFAVCLAQNLRFSNHAQKRLQSRQIDLSPDDLLRLSQAVEKAAQRGGRESLVLVDDLAFLVNVRERVVITAIDPEHRGEGVFTQVDSVVFAAPYSSAPLSTLETKI
ncbi:TIGR02530 family flagellar biosynthesis protein [Thermanaerothrix daxensis]|nr:TIGR02530 family flagellar biosynthesis protein [Thermanaerothrix daxensis]